MPNIFKIEIRIWLSCPSQYMQTYFDTLKSLSPLDNVCGRSNQRKWNLARGTRRWSNVHWLSYWFASRYTDHIGYIGLISVILSCSLAYYFDFHLSDLLSIVIICFPWYYFDLIGVALLSAVLVCFVSCWSGFYRVVLLSIILISLLSYLFAFSHFDLISIGLIWFSWHWLAFHPVDMLFIILICFL